MGFFYHPPFDAFCASKMYGKRTLENPQTPMVTGFARVVAIITYGHTFATRSLEQGMDIVTLSRLLGHANPSITMDKYSHALDDHKRSSIEKLGGLYGTASPKYAPHRYKKLQKSAASAKPE